MDGTVHRRPAATPFDELLLDPEYAAFLKRAAEENGYVDTGPLFPPQDVFNQWHTANTPNPHVWVPRERL